ncbi:hypothetical protein PA25_36130 [Pseudoalteromonas sp. A25]|uniref:hypothetical protein n=1 Tax=Pseudoalteromonas sp. A25 TaxID=116092 RepID=UPI001260A5F0|nr:hypothetical protein [Pseudoalteromonas sp. A25]BBN83628.1 hypothetical protein PA25_36130 [Pseudoalteromonas sp. A25]
MKTLLLVLTALASWACFGTQQQYLVTDVQIKNDTVLFKTHPKRDAITAAACVSSQQLDHWLIDLHAKGSTNMFSILLGAFDSATPVLIEGEKSCFADTNVELVKKVTVYSN